MAIYHDAYLFTADGFSTFIHSHNSNEDWEKLIEHAKLFAEDRFVLELGDNYGAWDYEGIVAELAEEKTNKPYLARFMFMIYLYKYLGGFTVHIEGLAHDWRIIIDSESLVLEENRELLVYGHPFNLFVEKWKINQTLLGKHLTEDIHPFSTAGQVGYLEDTEVVALHDKVQDILKNPEINPSDYNAITKAKNMLQQAIKANTGLCLISSG